MVKVATTVYVEDAILHRAHVMAIRRGLTDDELIEAALRAHLETGVSRVELSAGQMRSADATRLAVDEVRRFRAGTD